jgi:Fur family ferric uptake transcriptional regulator
MTVKEKDFQKEKQIFLEHIQKSGLRRTAQRDLILKIFLRTEEHLSSEDLYWFTQKEDSSIGHTTVYRTKSQATITQRNINFSENNLKLFIYLS